jgi:hypothetical protein
MGHKTVGVALALLLILIAVAISFNSATAQYNPGAVIAAPPTDDIVRLYEKGAQLYQLKEYDRAADTFETVAAMIRQKRGESLFDILPNAPSGYTADTPTISRYMGVFDVRGDYRNSEAIVSVTIVTDSPLVELSAALFSEPFGGARRGRFVLIDDRRVYFDPERNRLTAVVGNRAMVTVEGSHSLPEEELSLFWRGIDFDQLEGLVR